MKISTTRFLEIIRDSLEKTVAPELTNEGPRRALAIACAAIDELVKRETRTPAFLARTLPEGIEIARDLLAAVGCPDGSTPEAVTALLTELERQCAEPPRGGSACLQLYRQILAVLEDLTRTVASGRALDAAVAADHLALIGRSAAWENEFERAQLEPVDRRTGDTVADSPLTAELLQRFLRSELASEPDACVRNFELVPAGMVHETYGFTLESSSRSREEMIVRKTKGEPFVRINCFELHREFDLVRALHRTGYLLPEALWLARDVPGVSGEFYVMRKAPGSKNADLFSTDSSIHQSVLLGMAEQLGRLHTLPLAPFDDFIDRHVRATVREETAEQASRRNLEDWYDAWCAFARQPSPAEVFLLTWLRNNVPANDGRPALVHSDFTPHNCLWDGDRLTSVLDWEGAHFGDPAEDIAYIKPHIAARMNWNDWLARYYANGGSPVDESRIAYYTCYVHMRTVILANKIATRTEQGANSDIISLQIDQEYLPRTLEMCLESIRQHDAACTRAERSPS
jgi:aminoglycoside phosphotransferase (APT) family kinase protein